LLIFKIKIIKKMKLSEFKNKLVGLDSINFVQTNGTIIPPHFHITEVGLTTKQFIDCGGTVREEKYINFQLWEANDFDHRLTSNKLLNIIELSEKALKLGDYEVEVEYQTETIGRYSLEIFASDFLLISKKTDCLAKDNCGVQKEKVKLNLVDVQKQQSSCCSPSSGCCN
jgi:hypothetical protein